MLKLMKQAKAAFSLLSADEIAKQASVPVHIGLVADGSGAYAEMEELLVPSTLPRPEWRQRMMQVHRANDTAVPSNVDIVLYEPGLPCPVGSYSLNRSHPEATWAEILHDKPELDLALARQFIPFRRMVVERIIHMVSKENALFAVATAESDSADYLIVHHDREAADEYREPAFETELNAKRFVAGKRRSVWRLVEQMRRALVSGRRKGLVPGYLGSGDPGPVHSFEHKRITTVVHNADRLQHAERLGFFDCSRGHAACFVQFKLE